ncbi:MAG: ABC transporter ATP-binding protein [Thermaerobacter sp.]|nr:ABC transporter ATP-binding protein [Thermaerobacter sp.]
MIALEADGVTSGYGETVVVRNMNIHVDAGSVTCLLGRNGVGKTTLLKTIMGVVPRRSGITRLFGQDISTKRPYEIAARQVAYAPQESAVFADLSVKDNLTLGLKASEAQARNVLDEAFAAFPILEQRLSQKAGTLSGGEKKMLVFARALVRHPRVMIIDEISEGLQPSIVYLITELITRLKQNGVGIFLAEQNLAFAMAVGDSYVVMHRGTMVETGAIEGVAVARLEKHLSI